MTEREIAVLQAAAIECDEWGNVVERMIKDGRYRWRPFMLANANGQVLAYRNAAIEIRDLARGWRALGENVKR